MAFYKRWKTVLMDRIEDLQDFLENNWGDFNFDKEFMAEQIMIFLYGRGYLK